MKYTKILSLAAFASFGLSAGSASAATVFQVDDAVTIRDNVPDDNQNGSDQLIVGTTSLNEKLRALLEFDVSALSVSDPINSASLVLTSYSTAGFGGSQTFDLYTYGFGINEATATWNTPTSDIPADVAGGTTGTLLSSATFDTTTLGTTVTFASTAAFQTAVGSAIADNGGILGLILVHNVENNGNATHEFARFASNSFATEASRPELLVAVPEPGTYALLAGLTGLTFVMLRRRR